MTNVFQAPQKQEALKAAGVVNEEVLVDFNKVIQESLDGERVRLNRLNPIIRCDSLPHIQAQEKDMKQLSDHLIHLILLHPPQKSKLFIYIKCNRFNEVLPVETSGWQHSYEICFHTNGCREASWQAAYEKEIADCAAICTRYAGTFTAAYDHNDCLFKLTLPGKLF